MAAQCARSALQAGRCARSALQAAQCARSALQAGRCARSALQAGRCARSALQAGRCARSALQAGRCARSVLQAGRCARSALQAGRCACSALQAGQCACSALQAGRYARSALQAARCARSALQAAQCARSALQAGRCARSALQAAQCARSALHVAQCARSALQARRVASFLIPALFCRFPALYEERMTVAPPPASQPITDGHVAGQVGNGAARREARGETMTRRHHLLYSPLLTSSVPPYSSPLVLSSHLPCPPYSPPKRACFVPSLCPPPLTSLIPPRLLFPPPITASLTLHPPTPEVAEVCRTWPRRRTRGREAREIASTLTTSAPHTHHPPPLITTLHLPPPPLPFIHLSPLLPSTHLCSPALTSAPLRSPLLPCAHLCSPALTSAPLRSPLLPCTHLCSPALTSAPLHSPLLPCTHLYCSPTFHTTVSPSPTVHAIVSPSPNVHTTVFSVPRCSHHGFFPTVHPPFVPSVPSVHPSAIPACSPCSPHSLAMLPPLPPLTHCPKHPARGREAREIASTLTTSAPHTHHPPPLITTLHLPPPPLPFIHLSPLLPSTHLCSPALTSAPLRSPLLPCAHLCSPALTSAPLRSPLLPCAHLCSPALTSAPLHSSLLPCAHLCSPAVTSAPLRSPLLPCAHLCSPALTSAPLRSPLLPCAHLCSPALTSAPLHSPLLPCTHLCSPALTFTVHPLFTPPFPRPPLFMPLFPRPPLFTPLFPPSQVWEREVEHVSGGELQRFAVGVVGGQLGDRHLHVWEREVEHLSGGELQRFAIGVVAGQLGDIYMFDEPSSYLDVRQRLKAAQVIRSLLRPDRYVIVVEHDLSVLDYLSDFICCLYGKPGAYGVVTLPFSVREGINIFLAGFVPTENLRFRDESLTFRVPQSTPFLPSTPSPPPVPLLLSPSHQGTKTLVDNPEEGGQDVQSVRYRYLGMIKKHGGFNLLLPLPHSILSPPFIPSQVAETPVAETPVDNPEEAKTYTRYKYPRMVKKQGGFKLTVEPGDFTDSQIVVMLGENGTGKTTFIRMLAALSRPDPDEETGKEAQDPDEETGKEAEDLPEFNVSFKPQKISRKFPLSYPLADPDEETGKEAEDLPEFNVSYKPQKISPKFPHSVRALLHSKIRDSFHHPQFNTDVLRPMQIDPLLDQEVVNLSGGELQRVAITLCLGKIDPLLDQEVVKISGGELQRVAITLCLGKIDPLLDQEVVNLSGGELQRMAISLCLGKPADIYLIDEPSAYLDSEQRIVAAKPADIYLIDEPSAYLDSEQRIVAAKVIKRFILHAKKTAFVVEHDFIMATYLADRVIVYEGQPSVDCTARTPQSLNSGMNLFLSQLDITFRRDPTNFRPRINKMDSVKDREQKNAGTYYYLDD
ncbi:unnamed protein product [Closterium sp. NIES-65]|nr:unnamed protein product [Closterium sp. NIES-65]